MGLGGVSFGSNKSGNNAVVTLSRGGSVFSFELEQGFSDGYSNTFNIPYGLEFGTHPRTIKWEGGQFRDLAVAINLVVGVQTGLGSPADLVKAVENLFKLALAEKLKTIGKPVTMKVGSWFSRQGFIRDLSVDWREPYELSTGKPMVATVRFNFMTDFFPEGTIVDASRLPYSGTFRFKS